MLSIHPADTPPVAALIAGWRELRLSLATGLLPSVLSAFTAGAYTLLDRAKSAACTYSPPCVTATCETGSGSGSGETDTKNTAGEQPLVAPLLFPPAPQLRRQKRPPGLDLRLPLSPAIRQQTRLAAFPRRAPGGQGLT